MQTYCLDVEHSTEASRTLIMVPNLLHQNMAEIEIGKGFMLNHGYINNDFDVHEWAAPGFLEKAARELKQGTVA